MPPSISPNCSAKSDFWSAVTYAAIHSRVPRKSDMTVPESTLFESLGGAEGVAEVVHEMYSRILSDPELAHFFVNADMQRLKRMQTEFISAMVDGPVHYTGAELTEIHRGRGIERKHFSLFCGHLVSALEQRGVDAAMIDRIVGRLALYSDKITGSANVDG